MRRGFTMIELIFVIVILGILAAVALPKFMGVSQQAHEANLKSFVGTLNRTVGPSLWSQAISKGYDGNVTELEVNLSKYTDIPKEINGDINISECSNDETTYNIIAIADHTKAGNYYAIGCRTGNVNEAPKFVLVKDTSKQIAVGDANNSNVEVDVGKEINWTTNNKTSILLQK